MSFLNDEPLSSDRNEIQMGILLNMLSSFMGAKNEAKDFLLSTHLTQEKQSKQSSLKDLQSEVLRLLA